jgi:hypothetical protein
VLGDALMDGFGPVIRATQREAIAGIEKDLITIGLEPGKVVSGS